MIAPIAPAFATTAALRRAFVLLIVCMIMISMLAGCHSPANKSGSDAYPFNSMIFDASAISAPLADVPASLLVPKNVSEQCNVALYLDATKSMQGFISLDKPGNYEKVLQKIEETSFLTFKNSTFSYYRFWEKPQKIERDKFRTEAFTANFYNTANAGKGNDAAQTNLVNVFQSIGDTMGSAQDTMAVVVSDLVSTSKSDRSDVVRYLNDRFLRQGYSIAILGVQAAFSGKVYDIVADGQNYSFNYKGNRPYYMVILGGLANIRSFIGQFEKGVANQLAADQYRKVVIFNQALLEGNKPSLGAMTVEERYRPFVNEAQRSQLVQKKAVGQQAAASASYVQLFNDLVIELPDMSTPGFDITWPNPYQTDPESIIELAGWKYSADMAAVAGHEIDTETGEAFYPEKAAVKPVADGKPAYVQLTQPSVDSRSQLIKVPFKLIMKSMAKDQVYLLRVNLYGQPSFKAKPMPSWLNEWSMDFSKLDQWKKTPATFQCNTTPYLNELISTLWQKCASEAIAYPALPVGSYYLGFISCEPPNDKLLDACLQQIDTLKGK